MRAPIYSPGTIFSVHIVDHYTHLCLVLTFVKFFFSTPSVKVRPIDCDISPFLTGDQSASVRYIHMDEVPEQYSIGIFVFPPYAKIPLHDHPHMVVLSRVLYGDLTVKSYDIIHEPKEQIELCDPNHNHQSKHWYTNIIPAMKEIFSSNAASAKKPANKNTDESDTSSTTSETHQSTPSPLRVLENTPYRLIAPQVSTLYPHSGNVHEFTAGKYGAAILDCILPPYDSDHDRDCTFFVPEMIVSGEDECYLRPVPQSNDFHCISGVFGEVGMYDE